MRRVGADVLMKRNILATHALPTYQQRCFGPWININEEKDDAGTGKTLSAYWSIEDACHGGENVAAVKTGDGTYRGDNFHFTWKPIY